VEYMLFICTDPAAPKYVAAEDNIVEWVAEMEARGVARHGDRLRPVEDATTVRVRGGESGGLRWAVRGDEGMDRGL